MSRVESWPRSSGGCSSGATSGSSLSRKLATLDIGQGALIPGLPDDLACLCLACVPLWQHRRLRSVSRAWNAALSGKAIIELRQKLGRAEEFLCLFRDDPALSVGEVFDPRTRLWTTFPPMPCNHYTYSLSNFECVAVGATMYVLGGSVFDSRSFPMDRPLASRSVFKFDPVRAQWERCSDMRSPRGSFACGVRAGQVFVAGGGSRHAQFAVGGDRLASVEKYDPEKDQWDEVEGLHKIRAGCVGFFINDEFWVMGGYGHSRTISRVLPVDEYYRDGEVLNLLTGSWRPLEPMWEEGERARLGKVAVLDANPPALFMLDRSRLFKYELLTNRWMFESDLPRPIAAPESLCRVVALDGEVYVISGSPAAETRREVGSSAPSHQRGMEIRREVGSASPYSRASRGHRDRKRPTITFQVYHPVKRSWRLVSTKPPLNHTMNPPWGAMCVMKL